jgi:hypothetical protein
MDKKVMTMFKYIQNSVNMQILLMYETEKEREKEKIEKKRDK